MAIAKTNGKAAYLTVVDGTVMARVTYELKDGSTFITGDTIDLTVSNATSGEIAAAVSLISKAAALAVA
jgi:hypothetical protein